MYTSLYKNQMSKSNGVSWEDTIFSSAPNISSLIHNGSGKVSSGTLNTATGTTESSWSVDTSGMQKVFKLQTYYKNEKSGYTYFSYGSAILVWENKILTNAHVIMGKDDMPTGKYNLCISMVDGGEPVCVTSLKLLKYDTLKDIALLEPTKKISLWTPLKLVDRKLSLGEIVKVFGYPSNGGDTLSFTEWKMSGTEKSYYKIDANIDHGNSWGGAFDKDDIFIGMPYVAQTGLTTMGYLIPVKMINDFLSGIGDIRDYSIDESAFSSYIENVNMNVKNQSIQNPFFTFDGFSQSGFTIKEISWDVESGYAQYFLTTESQNTIIVISVPYIQWDRYFPPSSNVALKETFATANINYDVVQDNKKIDEKTELIGRKKSNGTVDENIAVYHYDMWSITFDVKTKANIAEKNDVRNALDLFKNNFHIIKTNTPIHVNNIDVYSGSFQLPQGSYVVQSCRIKCEYRIFLDTDSKIDFSSTDMPLDKDDRQSFDNVLERLKKIMSYQSSSEKNSTVEIRRNTSGLQYIYARQVASNNSIVISAIFYGKEKDNAGIVYTLNLTLESENETRESIFNSLVDSFTSILSNPFLDSEGVSDNKIQSSDTQAVNAIGVYSWSLNVDTHSTTEPIHDQPSVGQDQMQASSPPVQGSGIDYCKTVSEWVTYTLSPCSIDTTMSLSEWDTSFEYKIIPSDSDKSYILSVYGYGEGFPTYGILGWSSGWASGTQFQNPYFSSSALKKWTYDGYLKIKISGMNGAQARELRFKIHLKVNP